MTIKEINDENYRALRKNIIQGLSDETKTREEIRKEYKVYDAKISRFHIHGLISDKQLAKLDALIFDICENVLYN